MLPVSLCVDLGNTNYKAAIFQSDRLVDTFFFKEQDAISRLRELMVLYNPEKSILASVVNHEEGIVQLLKDHTRYFRLSTDSKLPYLNAYGSPETLGHDRIALVAGLSRQFPGENSLAISIGTCITYNFLAKNNAFRGGAISPGVDIRLKGMSEFTARLPLVQREGHLALLGYDTETSLRSGAINGVAAEIDGMIERFEQQYGRINAVLTGGDAPFFVSRLKNKIFADTNFLFKGLYAILEHNQ
ncbi:MAG TPA: type III pantothenate kinase [Chitinophagaceae bacterium]|nr:type III pantothenate kinase [Chitinophagaceae bacterium]